MSQQYSLRWNNHQPNFISMFTSLLNTQTLVDVTLSAEGQQLKAHKVVLSACSIYFQTLFVDNPSQHPIVILKDVTFADLRTMVDFMYYGEVNVTEHQLPKVLETARHLKIKGLTEMPDTASLRAQGTAGDFTAPVESSDSPWFSASSSPSPATKRKRRRKSSTGSTSLNMVIGEENRQEEGSQTVDLVRGETITLSSLPQQQRRVREYQDERTLENMQQPAEPQNINVEQLSVETNPPAMSQAARTLTTAELKLKRTKSLRRQSRVNTDERIEVRKQVSEPTPRCTGVPTLQKHESYPECGNKQLQRMRLTRLEHEVESILVQDVTVTAASESTTAQRASHTPAVRSGPPLSCHFCWNTVDEIGRILRRKTQYHCPECRTNLCIVPCFQEYHEGRESESTTNAK